MFCPKCATQNADNASFCRGCGSNISLVPQALTGHLAAAEAGDVEERDGRQSRRARRRERQGKQPPSVEEAIRHIFMGMAFLLIFVCGALFLRGRFFMWFWAIIPGLAMIGDGVGKWIRYTHEQRALARPGFAPQSTPLSSPPRAGALPHASDDFMIPPASVTESTTRHLETSKRANS